MGEYLRRSRIHRVHTFDVPLNIFGVPTARIFHRPVVISSQRAYGHLSSGLFRRLLQFTDRLSDAIVVNCEAIRRHVIDDEHVPPDRVHVCYNGIDVDPFRGFDGAQRLQPCATRPSSSGSLARSARKDLFTLLRALE